MEEVEVLAPALLSGREQIIQFRSRPFQTADAEVDFHPDVLAIGRVVPDFFVPGICFSWLGVLLGREE